MIEQYNGGVYMISTDENPNLVKIGKSDNVYKRILHLQIGNPHKLKIIHFFPCPNEKASLLLERKLHKKFRLNHVQGEWYNINDYSFMSDNKILNFSKKISREPITSIDLFGEENTLIGRENHPFCYFYQHLYAQILTSYEDAVNIKIPYRTMEWPTNGKKMLLPYSNEINKVFICGKKHNENMELNRFNKNKQSPNILEFIE